MVFDLPRVIQFDQVEGFEDVVHFVLVHFSVGVVTGTQGRDLVVDGVVVFLFLGERGGTME